MENKDTREKTAEEYIESKVKDVLCGNGYDEMIYKHDVLEAIRLSKIEALQNAVEEFEESNIYSFSPFSKEVGKVYIAILNLQITELKNGK